MSALWNNQRAEVQREVINHRKLLKREMQACVKAIRCTSKTQRLLQRWRRKYAPETYQELLRIARNPLERRAVANWLIVEPRQFKGKKRAIAQVE